MKLLKAIYLLVLTLLLTLIPLVISADGHTNGETEIYLPAIYAPPGNWIAAYSWYSYSNEEARGIMEIGDNQYKLIGHDFVINLNGDGTAEDIKHYSIGADSLYSPMSANRYVTADIVDFFDDNCGVQILMFDQYDVNLWARNVTLSQANCPYPYGLRGLVADSASIYTHLSNGHNNWLNKLDKHGNLAWSKLISNQLGPQFQDMTISADAGLVFTGKKSWGSHDLLLVKLDSSGNLVKAKELLVDDETVHGVWPGAISSTSDDGYILAVSIGYQTEINFFVLKLDKNLDMSWQKRFKLPFYEPHISLVKGLRDGGALLQGDGSDYLLRIHADGSPAWLRAFKSQYYINDIGEASDGSILVAGVRHYEGYGQPLSMKLSPDGLVGDCDLISNLIVESSDLDLVMSSTAVDIQDVSAEINVSDLSGTGSPLEVQSIALCGAGATAVNCR